MAMHLRSIVALLGILPFVVGCSDAPLEEDLYAGRETFSGQRDKVHLAQARRELAAGRTAAARRELQGLSAEARSASMYMLLAEADLRDQRINAAMTSLAAAADLEPDNPGVDMLRGMVFESIGNWADASRAYRTAAGKDRDNIDAVLANARVLHAAGDGARAVVYLEREASARPMDFRLSLAAGKAYLAVGSFYDAISHYSTAGEMRPEHTAAREGLVVSLSLSGNHTEALERSQDLAAGELGPMSCLALGRSALVAGRPQRAVPLLNAYLFGSEKDAAAHLDLARAYFLDRQADMALAAVRRVLKLRPRDPAAFTLLGHIRLRSGQQDLAFAAYERAILAGGDAILLTELMDRARRHAELQEDGEL
jgi:Flp pilus assembly protein TadD